MQVTSPTTLLEDHVNPVLQPYLSCMVHYTGHCFHIFSSCHGLTLSIHTATNNCHGEQCALSHSVGTRNVFSNYLELLEFGSSSTD